MALNGLKTSNSDRIYNEGSWNEEQCLKYLIFLDLNKSIMTSRQKKKIYRVFDQMSQFIETRTSLQCRSHHQKAIERHKQIKQIIEHQKKTLDIHTYRIKLKETKDQAKIRENPKNPIPNYSANSEIAIKYSESLKQGNGNFQMPSFTATNFYNIIPSDFYQMYQLALNNFGFQFYCFPNFPIN